MADNSALAEAIFSGSRLRGLVKTGRTRLSQKMMMELVARFRGREPIGREDTGNSERRSEMH